MPTIKQKWARKRNWNKSQVRMVIAILQKLFADDTILADEAKCFAASWRNLEKAIDRWEENNKSSQKIFITLSRRV